MAQPAMGIPVTTDQELWPPGFVAFYEREYRSSVRTARLIVGRADVAEELVQDVFIQVGHRWHTIETPRAYLRRSVVNAATRQLDRQRRERTYVASQRPIAVAAPEIAETVHALDVLSPRRRSAVVLRYYEDLSDNEIAELLGCRTGTVRSLIHRALRQLHKEMS